MSRAFLAALVAVGVVLAGCDERAKPCGSPTYTSEAGHCAPSNIPELPNDHMLRAR